MARSMKVKAPSEHEEQAKVVAWLESYASAYWRQWAIMDGKIPFFAIPNSRDWSKGARSEKEKFSLYNYFKKEGFKKGVPDMMTPVPNAKYHSLWIEMKRTEGGVISIEQDNWLNTLIKLGHRAVVCRGADAAIKEITNYLNETRKV